jgi:hypothetical protein
VVENVFKLLSISSLNIKHSTSVVFKAAHALNVVSNRLRLEPPQNVPDQTDSKKWLLHRNLESNAILLAVQQTAGQHFFFVMA